MYRYRSPRKTWTQNFQPPGSALWPPAAVAVPPGATRCRRPRWSEALRWPRCRRRPRSCGSGGCPFLEVRKDGKSMDFMVF